MRTIRRNFAVPRGSLLVGPLLMGPLLAGSLLAAMPMVMGCWNTSDNAVVVYSSLDREFSQPILDDFQRETKIKVLVKFDNEANKTVGLANAIIAESSRPRCDLFWNNEILHTLRLEKRGLLVAYQTPAAEVFPEDYRSPQGRWFGFAARARVLIVNTQLLAEVPRQQWPQSIHDLVAPQYKGKVGIARPLYGTTATHAAVLFAKWGDEKAEEFFRRVKENSQILPGNKQVALDVARGILLFGLTDTDDAVIQRDEGWPVEIVFPDQLDGQLGTLFIPNTLCLIRNSPHPGNARKLVDYLLQPRVEERLAQGLSAQFPLNLAVRQKSRAEAGEPIRMMQVDFSAAAEKWEKASQFLRKEFAGGN